MKRVFLALSVLTIAILACNQTLPTAPTQPPPAVQVQTNPALPVGSVNPVGQQEALVTLYDSVIPGVVAIRTETGLGSGFMFDNKISFLILSIVLASIIFFVLRNITKSAFGKVLIQKTFQNTI